MNNFKILDINYKIIRDDDGQSNFMYELYYEKKFNEIRLSELLFEVISIIRSLKTQNTPDCNLIFNIAHKLFSIYSFALESLIAHFKPNDCYKIINLAENYWLHIERLKCVSDAFISFDYTIILSYEDELGKLVDDIENE